jgi:hypothetical protein
MAQTVQAVILQDLGQNSGPAPSVDQSLVTAILDVGITDGSGIGPR